MKEQGKSGKTKQLVQLGQREGRKRLKGFLVPQILLGRLKEEISVKICCRQMPACCLLTKDVMLSYANAFSLLFSSCVSWKATWVLSFPRVRWFSLHFKKVS